jgi:hypothetical protein
MSDETVTVAKDDLVRIEQGLEQIIRLTRAQLSMAGSQYETIRPREVSIAAATMQRMIKFYLRTTPEPTGKP